MTIPHSVKINPEWKDAEYELVCLNNEAIFLKRNKQSAYSELPRFKSCPTPESHEPGKFYEWAIKNFVPPYCVSDKK